MVDGLWPVDGSQAQSTTLSARASGPARSFAVATTAAGQSSDLPPAEVLDALDTAARVLDELDRKNVSIRLEHDAATNELRARVSDAGGGSRELSHARLLNVLAGDTASLYAKR